MCNYVHVCLSQNILLKKCLDQDTLGIIDLSVLCP